MRKLKLVWLSLTALTLVSCAHGLKPFPTRNIYEVDVNNNVCGEYVVVNFEKLQFEHVRDLPLSACDGVFGFSNNKIGLILDWAEIAIKKAKERCD